MEAGYDILFWVARMILMTTFMIREVPSKPFTFMDWFEHVTVRKCPNQIPSPASTLSKASVIMEPMLSRLTH